MNLAMAKWATRSRRFLLVTDFITLLIP